MSDPAVNAASARPSPSRSILPWVLLALWVLWMAALAWMARGEFSKERPRHERERNGISWEGEAAR